MTGAFFLVEGTLRLLLLLLLLLFGRKQTLYELTGEFGKVLTGTPGVIFLVLCQAFAHGPDVIIEVGLTQKFIHDAYKQPPPAPWYAP